jgi:hypothetical protein
VDKSAPIPGVSATENQHFEELLKLTMQQIQDVNQQYQE